MKFGSPISVLDDLIAPASISVAAQVLVAVVLSWICIELFKGVRDPGTQRGDALVLDLGLGLAAVTAAVLWLSVSLQIVF